jgi:protein-S-isoprenylcysteine O-methyltransferase Ste14
VADGLEGRASAADHLGARVRDSWPQEWRSWLHAFVRFVIEGVGTPAPVAPTRHLVIGGLYRYVRNPMYIAVALTILGQAMVLGRPVLLLYALVFGVAVGSFVHFYEQPTLTRQFGAEYEAYRDAVPAWLPRRRPWRPDRPTYRSDDAAR